jgi:hypothetical protein
MDPSAAGLQRNILHCIGKTSLMALRKIGPENGIRILLKLESENPSGSMKDRMALAMIEAAEADGRLAPDGSVVEYTGGSTGVSLALICAVKGYPLDIVTSDAFAREKLEHMKILGAKLQILRSQSGRMTEKLTRDMIEAARIVARETGSFWTDQMNNRDQIVAYHAMAEEIWTQTDGQVDGFVQSVGTAASLRGIAEALRAATVGSGSLPWSLPNPRFCRVAGQAPIRSMGSVPGSSCRSGGRISPIGSSRSRRKRQRPWRFGWRGRKGFLPAHQRAPMSSPHSDWPKACRLMRRSSL